MKNQNIISIVIVGVFLGLVVWLVNRSTPSTEPLPVSANVNDSVSGTEVPADTFKNDVKEFIVESGNFYFLPAVLRVKKGDKVRIVLKNKEGVHDFRIDEFAAATGRIRGAGEDVADFTADKTGTFEYYCSVGSHRMMGMKGSLIVE